MELRQDLIDIDDFESIIRDAYPSSAETRGAPTITVIGNDLDTVAFYPNLGVTTEEIFPNGEPTGTELDDLRNDSAADLVNRYSVYSKRRKLAKWAGQTVSNRYLIGAAEPQAARHTQPAPAMSGPRHRADPLLTASEAYELHVRETWTEGYPFTVGDREGLNKLLNPEPVPLTRRQIREQERALELQQNKQHGTVRRLGNTCLRWALSKLEK